MLPILNHLPKKKTPSYWKQVKKDLKSACHETQQTKPHLSLEDHQLLQEIRLETSLQNRDNVTRTKAYLDFYMEHKEIHWSLLAHMVSRNAGWSMTDLKGEYLPTILSTSKQKAFFSFLEKGNWLIFQDAYPQLLLYKYSTIQSKSLFHLLPHLHVSTFMEVIWNWYVKTKDASLLTSALIINEQNYIESRLIQNFHFKNSVLNTLTFQLQDLLNTNTILFPMIEDDKIRLIGATVHHFSELNERIKLGKHLYQLLFSTEATLKSILNWGLKHPHTGSRKDYWDHLFHSIKEGIPGEKRVLTNCEVQSGPRIYSPDLSIWKKVAHQTPDHQDWFTSDSFIKFLIPSESDSTGDVKRIHCRTLEMLERLT
ncbi:DUF2515 family protein [Guptibacillus algicola]|uniref:DUF2515 family protein n=1 Tax=Guptibacillus algicola TaxID=225844 RepID=UPI001CD6A421|nr:DUF2515 family protein [Alkalihalobacillus algicola]MCA0988840.1 DUF2515 domain-containing protein [Alkalihalobacillus algicola]